VSALSAGGNYDVISAWLILWQLCISRRPRAFIWDTAFNRDPAFMWTQASKPRRLLQTRRLFGTRRLIEVLR